MAVRTRRHGRLADRLCRALGADCQGERRGDDRHVLRRLPVWRRERIRARGVRADLFALRLCGRRVRARTGGKARRFVRRPADAHRVACVLSRLFFVDGRAGLRASSLPARRPIPAVEVSP